MRICIDLDGTICETRKSYESYSNVKPIKNAIVAIKSLKKKGHTIIIYTSRHMKTCNNNIGRITALQGKIIFDWLDKHSSSPLGIVAQNRLDNDVGVVSFEFFVHPKLL
jgi:capsule biosynthesis phosphatase